MRPLTTLFVVAAGLVALSACSEDTPESSPSDTESTAAPGSSTADPADDAADPADDAAADPADTADTAAMADTTLPADDAEPADDANPADLCGGIPELAAVEAASGVELLAVTFEEYTGCVYPGDENNTAVYFHVVSDEFELTSLATADPAFFTPVESIPGALASGDSVYFDHDGIVLKVTAQVNGTEADTAIEIDLMQQWLELAP